MDPDRMRRHAPHSPLVGTAWLEGWRLTFAGADLGWEGALATVVEDPNSRVFVALYDVPEHDEPSLDQWEGDELVSHRKIHTRVNARITSPQRPGSLEYTDADAPVLEKSVMVWFYVLDAYEGGLPSAHYLGILADSAEAAGAPRSYAKELRMRSCDGFGPGQLQ